MQTDPRLLQGQLIRNFLTETQLRVMSTRDALTRSVGGTINRQGKSDFTQNLPGLDEERQARSC